MGDRETARRTMKRIGVTVDDETHKRFKVVCALNLETMEEVLREMIEEYVKLEDEKNAEK
jgi:hypothetical protein